MFRFHFILLTYVLLGHLRAEPEAQVFLRYEVFRLPKVAAVALQQPQPKDADLYAALQKSVEAGSVVADKMILLRKILGQDAKVQQLVEFPVRVKDLQFRTQTLGEVLALSREVSDETNEFLLKISGNSTRLGPVVDGKPTFPEAKVSGVFQSTSEQIKFLGTLAEEPTDPSHANSVALAFVSSTIQQFQETDKEPPESRRFRCQYEVISLPQAVALKLVQMTPDSVVLFGKVNELIGTKVAALETLQMVQVLEGQKCKVEHIDEFPYPMDFEPVQTVFNLAITDPALKEELLKPSLAKKHLPPPNAGSSLTIPPLGIAYQDRNLGDSLEVEASSCPDGSVSVTLNAEKVRLLSMDRFDDVVQPSFGLQKISTTVRLKPNIPLLIGTMNRAQDTGAPKAAPEPRVWLAFLTLRG